jgi:uracil-DNA glycosylase
MTEHDVPGGEPRNPQGPFHDLMGDIRSCKRARTCPSLTSRGYYFEPNPVTIDQWRAEGLYKSPIDRRVVFVSESPGKTGWSEDTSRTIRCWTNTEYDDRFRQARERFGFINCYLTNVVKCGVRAGASHTDHELASCRRFLVRELELVRPWVVVGVGHNAYDTLRADVLRVDLLPDLHPLPQPFYLTHFSAHFDVWPRWEREFGALNRLLDGLKPSSGW